MRKLLTVSISLFLTSCTLGSPTLTFPTPTIDLSILSATPAVTASPLRGTPALSTPSPTQAPSDPFAANFIQPPAPVCDFPTPEQTEGPYYKSGSPERKVLLEPDTQGEKLIVAGFVVDQNCQPIPGTLLEFWQADGRGEYDNAGYRLRGHQFTDEQGRYFLETVMPGQYTGRTEHIHLKIQPPGGALITSQLYFPNSSANSGDGIFDGRLLVTLEEREGFYVAYFNFVIVP